MELNVEKEVSLLKKMSVGELREHFLEVFGEPTNTRNKQWLIRRIAWKMQANIFGDISERARKRALEIAKTSDIRTTAPKTLPTPNAGSGRQITGKISTENDHRLPPPGNDLFRVYKGEEHRVRVVIDGFVYNGEKYKSLTAVAKKITGQHCNGYHFFNLNDKKGAKS